MEMDTVANMQIDVPIHQDVKEKRKSVIGSEKNLGGICIGVPSFFWG